MWKLVIEDDEGKRTVVPLTRDDYTIGRKEGNTIRLTERNVSRAHAKIRKLTNGAAAAAGADRSHYLLEDQQSYNGVYVNGIRVAQTQELGHGDLVQIGDYRIVLQDDSVIEAPPPSQPDPKATVPPGATGRASLLMERPNRFVMLAGPTPGAEYPLDGERLTVGRAEDASISINHNSVSRLHCEIHSLGDGRFEIVDKGSSNGVRVNTAELRRGIIEPGDVIELGDVKFKFVGAGQIFLPGVNDSQQLSAIGERSSGGRRGSGLLPYVVFGAVIAVAAVGVWAFTRPKPEPVVITPAVSSAGGSRAAIARRRQAPLRHRGLRHRAREDRQRDLADGSPLRETADFRGDRAPLGGGAPVNARTAEQDLAKKRSLLSEVAGDPSVDAARRKRAADKLQPSTPAAPTPSQLPAPTKDAASPERLVARGGPPRRVAAFVPDTRRVTPAPAPAPAPAPVAPGPKPAGTDVHQLLLQDTSSIAAARSILEPKVFGNRATGEEIRMLKSICKSQHDELCVEKCKSLLGQ